jgi:1,4-alpha-glucan branching enzyme
MLQPTPSIDIHALMHAQHRDPFAVLGPHRVKSVWWVRALLPKAQAVTVVVRSGKHAGKPLAQLVRVPHTD